MLFLSLVRGSGTNQGVTIFWQLIEMSGLLGELYTELYRAVHRTLSATRSNEPAFKGEVYTGRIGPIVGTLESVHKIEVLAFQGFRKVGFHCTLKIKVTYVLRTLLDCFMPQFSFVWTSPVDVQCSTPKEYTI